MTKLKAVELIIDKVWITYDDKGNKIGLLQVGSGDVVHMKHDGTRDVFSSDSVNDHFELVKKEADEEYENHVFGYPVKEGTVFNKQDIDNLPCFTKKEKSQAFYVAGWIGVRINDKWHQKFCPRLSTVKNRQTIGPFKSKVELSLSIKRQS